MHSACTLHAYEHAYEHAAPISDPISMHMSTRHLGLHCRRPAPSCSTPRAPLRGRVALGARTTCTRRCTCAAPHAASGEAAGRRRPAGSHVAAACGASPHMRARSPRRSPRRSPPPNLGARTLETPNLGARTLEAPNLGARTLEAPNLGAPLVSRAKDRRRRSTCALGLQWARWRESAR